VAPEIEWSAVMIDANVPVTTTAPTIRRRPGSDAAMRREISAAPLNNSR
jgi:hypothetical protein